MKCLSVLQPYASLIALAGHPDPEVRRLAKKFETRSWPTKYRGTLAIHASKEKKYIDMRSDYYICGDEPFYSVLMDRAKKMSRIDPFKVNLPRGAVIATCRLVDCIEIVWSLEDVDRIAPSCLIGEHGKVYTISDNEAAFGDYNPGRYAFILDDVKPLPEPVPAKGRLGLWEWTPPEGVVSP